MRRGHFPLSALPAWCVLNDVSFVDVEVADIDGRGLGLVAERDLINEEGNVEIPTLLTIPKDLVLSAAGVEEYARENKDFRQLLNAAGRQSPRGDILLFLMAQLVLSSPDYAGGQGPLTPWAQYFNILPTQVPVPTMWTESELSHLAGTSLEPAVAAKFSVLTKEFDDIRAKSEDIPYWNQILSVDEMITDRDWVLLDALYRSRSLDLPKSGESMVPCLDLVNHSSNANAYFEENSRDEVTLLLRNGSKVSHGEEITIDYGQDKSAAEMLFSYGFIDTQSIAKKVILPLEPIQDDPLGKAKLHAFGPTPVLEIKDDGGGVQWSAPFVYLMCLNEEDGLEFKVLQETDGSRHLKMHWQGVDITETPKAVQELIKGHDLQQVFQLRAVTVVLETVDQHLQKINSPNQPTNSIPGLVRAEVLQAASHLRAVESDLLERARQVLNDQTTQLFSDPSVLAYLESMGDAQNEEVMVRTANEDEDFS
ncbi:hypothetical protein F4809DRAFT_644891 [Biscogniauxia mediterranea]|nr:hypothetical protein F4809DRAFT_644891 [Biscogniauxia mediterranea]